MATLQQRLVESQQEMEREYTRIRNAEKRYRLLFQLAAEAVLILNSGAARIIDVNPAAAHLLGAEPRRLIGKEFEDLLADSSRQAIRSFLAATRVAPRVDRVHAELAEDHAEVLITGSLYRQDGAPHLVVLLSRMGEAAAEASPAEANILRLVEVLPEAFVVVGADRRVLSANAAFLDLVQATSANQVKGKSIERWMGRQSVETDVLFSNLRAHGSVRHFSTVVRGELGTTEDVELVAVSTVGRAAPIFGLTIRAAGWRGGSERLGGRELPRTVEQFTELVGRVPMKNLVRETTEEMAMPDMGLAELPIRPTMRELTVTDRKPKMRTSSAAAILGRMRGACTGTGLKVRKTKVRTRIASEPKTTVRMDKFVIGAQGNDVAEARPWRRGAVACVMVRKAAGRQRSPVDAGQRRRCTHEGPAQGAPRQAIKRR